MTLKQLAQKAGLTYPTVALVETNKTLPSMKTLDALAGALEISASELLSLVERRTVQIRKAEGLVRPGRKNPQVGLDKLKVAYFDKGKLIRVKAEKDEEIHVMELNNNCHEVCYVLSGVVSLRIEGNVHKLYPDDTILFDGVLDHSFKMIQSGEFISVHIPKDIHIIEALLDSIQNAPVPPRSPSDDR